MHCPGDLPYHGQDCRAEMSTPVVPSLDSLCIQAEVGVCLSLKTICVGSCAAEWQVEGVFAMAKGTIKKLIADKGYGFIRLRKGKSFSFTGISFKALSFLPSRRRR